MEVRMERLKHVIEVNVLLGAWLIAAPFVLGYTSLHFAMGNDIVLGASLIACSWWILAASAAQIGAGGLQLLAGLWLIAAPFAWHYGRSSRPFDNDLAVGILTVLVSASAIWMLNSRLRKGGAVTY
jgi:hypothetical protein